ncbi:hypothetical protein OC835_003583 [Tilletia horrida]|nr:hypothetical protein OC835_003583 [Tilletia horrida]
MASTHPPSSPSPSPSASTVAATSTSHFVLDLSSSSAGAGAGAGARAGARAGAGGWQDDGEEEEEEEEGMKQPSSYYEYDHAADESLGLIAHTRRRRAGQRPRQRRCTSWPCLFAVLITASALFVLGLSRTQQQPSPPPHSSSSTTVDPDLDSPSSQDASTIALALGRPLPPQLHHDSPSFAHFDLDYYALPLAHRTPIRPIASLQLFLAHSACADDWVSSGTLCAHAPALFTHATAASLDILYTWVNGSAPHTANRKLYSDTPQGWWEEHWHPDPDPATESQQAQQAHHKRRHQHRRAVPLRNDAAAITKNKSPTYNHNHYHYPVPKLKADNGDNRFRDTSELQYSVRSSLRFIKNLNHIHIVSPDFAAPLGTTESTPHADLPTDRFLLPAELLRHESHDVFRSFPGNATSPKRAGQVPHWLDTTRPDVLVGDAAAAASDKQHTLRVHHDWSAFRPSWLLSPQGLSTVFSQSQIEAWKHAVLPTFNSMAIETYLGHEAGLSDVFAYANDDFFLSDTLTVGDVHTPLYGLVLRFQPHLPVIGHQSGFVHPADHAKGGEWPSYRRSAWLLDQRFGTRQYGRAYLSHVHKSFHRALLDESRIVFDKPIRDAAGSRFRGLSESLNTPFLTQSFVIERHREALLWSFFLLRHDLDGDGFYARSSAGGDGEWHSLLREMGVGSEYSVRPLASFSSSSSSNAGKGGPQALNNIVIVPHFPSALSDLAARNLSIAVPMPRRASLRASTSHLQRLAAATAAAGGAGAEEGAVPEPGMSTFQFSHLDGYPFVHLEPYMQDRTMGFATAASPHSPKFGAGGFGGSPPGSPPQRTIREPWPVYWPASAEEEKLRFVFNPRRPACRIELAVCLRPEWSAASAKEAGLLEEEMFKQGPRADEVFKRFAFEKVECGDCLIQFLLHKSGESGFSAFMPADNDDSLLFPREPAAEIDPSRIPSAPQEPHLPLVARFDDDVSGRPVSGPAASEADAEAEAEAPKTFTLQTVATLTGWLSLPRRAFARALLTRYAYVLADSPIDFVQVSLGFRSNSKALWKAGEHKGFLCVNDDVVVGARAKANGDDVAVQKVVRQFFESKWPHPSKYERQ